MKYLFVLLAFSLTNFAHGLNHFTEPYFKAINFAEVLKGHRLHGSVINDFAPTSEESCQFECVRENGCLSYNFFPIQGKCQLSNSDRFVGHLNFTKEEGVLYRGIQVTEIKNTGMTFSLIVAPRGGEKAFEVLNYDHGRKETKSAILFLKQFNMFSTQSCVHVPI